MNKSVGAAQSLTALDPSTSSTVSAAALSTPAAVGFPDVSKVASKLFRKPDFDHEQTVVLLTDAANLQALIAHVDLWMGTAYAAFGKGITKPVSGALEDFHGFLTDHRSELMGLYDGIEAELDRRGAV